MKLVASPWLLRWFARRVRPLSEFDPATITGVVVVNATALGDTLLSTPVLRALRQRLPSARLVWMMHPAWIPLFSAHPHVDALIPFDNRFSSLYSVWKQRRRHGCELAVISHGNDPEASYAALLLGARFVIKSPHGDHPELHSNREGGGISKDDHGVYKRLAALDYLTRGHPLDVEPRMELVPPPEGVGLAVAWCDRMGLVIGQRLVGFQVGASTVSRRWPPRHFAALARMLLARDAELRIVLLGSAREQSLTLEVLNGLTEAERGRMVDGAGALPIQALPTLLQRFTLLVTPDTGVMHLAVALRIPTVTLFAVAHYSGSGALVDLERHRFIQGQTTCLPCLAKACPGPEAECMAAISPEMCDRVVGELLERLP